MASIPIPRRYRTVVYIPSRSDGCMLEVLLSIPTNTTSQPLGYTGVVISHPYGPLGGSYNNNVVGALLQWFETCSLHTAGEDLASNTPSSPSKKNSGSSNLRQHNTDDDGSASNADSAWVLLKPSKKSSKDQAIPLSCVICAFNFRGCGKSKGRTSWFGEAEREDYQTIIDVLQSGSHTGSSHLQSRGPRDPGASTSPVWSGKAYDETGREIDLPRIPFLSRFILCGYSYGGMIASTIPPPFRNPSDPTSKQLPTSYVLISYPAGVAWFLVSGSQGSFSKRARAILLGETDLSVSSSHNHLETELIKNGKRQPIEAYFITGSEDQFTAPKTLLNWLKTNTGLNPPKRLATCGSWASKRPDGAIHLDVVEGVDHFWLDREQLLLERLQSWWSEVHQ
ncbi:hypothetical protein BGX27_007798 [Mortierella sp. AM989]|nr:hypothetical protein BGX27_007798 [Mortierella sp. AM989]